MNLKHKTLRIFRPKQLAQLRPMELNMITLYSSGVGKRTAIRNFEICNTTNLPAIFSIFLDTDGVTFDETTALHYEQPIPAKTTVTLRKELFMEENTSGSVGLKTNTIDALTFTMNGEEYT